MARAMRLEAETKLEEAEKTHAAALAHARKEAGEAVEEELRAKSREAEDEIRAVREELETLEAKAIYGRGRASSLGKNRRRTGPNAARAFQTPRARFVVVGGEIVVHHRSMIPALGWSISRISLRRARGGRAARFATARKSEAADRWHLADLPPSAASAQFDLRSNWPNAADRACIALFGRFERRGGGGAPV